MRRIDWFNIERQDKEIEFEKLVDSVRHCSLCPDMETRTGVLSELNGNIYSNLLFIAEAPGRLGADKTRIPLFGDQTGVNFQRLIDTINWTREDFFITNAVLCNPRNSNGNNITPRREHIKNCSVYLKLLIDLMNPEYVVTLGQKALESLNYIQKTNVSLKSHVRTKINWYGRTLIPLYHMGPRALIHRSFYNQLADFYWLNRTVKIKSKSWERLKKNPFKKIKEKFNPSKLQNLIIEIIMNTGPISEFKLTKLIYLTDYNFLKENRKLLTNSYYLRAYEGPLPIGLDNQINELINQGIIKKIKVKISLTQLYATNFTDKERKVIHEVINRYSNKSDKEIKISTYLTPPMKRILLKEKKLKEDMLLKPIFSEEDFQ